MDKNMEMTNATILTFAKAIKSSANLIYKDMEELYPYEMEQLSIIEDYMMLGYDANKRILQEKPVIQNLGEFLAINDKFAITVVNNFEDLVVARIMSNIINTYRITKYINSTKYPKDNMFSVIEKTITMFRVPDLSRDVAIRISLGFGYNISNSGAMQIAYSKSDDYDVVALIDLAISHNFSKIHETLCKYLKKLFKANEVYTKPILNRKQIPEEKHQEVIDEYIEELSYYMIAFYMVKYVYNVEEFLKGRV